MEPTVQRVAETVQEMLARPWPRTDAELDEWVRWHHLVGVSERLAPLPDWGAASGHLTRHGGRFVGAGFFLWHDLDPISLIERFRQLSAAFTSLCGEPGDTWGATGAPAATWRTPDHVVELYAHTSVGPCVQLAVNDAELADALEAEARARLTSDAHPLAALGTPVDSASFMAAQDQLAARTSSTDGSGTVRSPGSADHGTGHAGEIGNQPEGPDAD